VARGDLPELVRRPDGRNEPFEPERIARGLFAAGERMGRADAFLARELTDSVLHFLATEGAGPVTTPAQVAEVVGKVVRELGHPALAIAYEERGSARAPAGHPAVAPEPSRLPDWLSGSVTPAAVHLALAQEHLRAFCLAALIPRDLVSAHQEGLIQLTGLEHPRELDATVAHVPPAGVAQAVTAARTIAGRVLAIDGPEFDLATLEGDAASLADTYVHTTRVVSEALGLRVILNLNASQAPPRSAEAPGPLFRAGHDALAGRRRVACVGRRGRSAVAGRARRARSYGDRFRRAAGPGRSRTRR
jgi:ATP cone domain